MIDAFNEEQRSQVVQAMHGRAQSVLMSAEKENESFLQALSVLDADLRQFFDSLSVQDPVTSAELSILEDVGALLNRAKTLAVMRREHVLEELKNLRTSRSGIQAYKSANAMQ